LRLSVPLLRLSVPLLRSSVPLLRESSPCCEYHPLIAPHHRLHPPRRRDCTTTSAPQRVGLERDGDGDGDGEGEGEGGLDRSTYAPGAGGAAADGLPSASPPGPLGRTQATHPPAVTAPAS
jgi:hypothetical protein